MHSTATSTSCWMGGVKIHRCVRVWSRRQLRSTGGWVGLAAEAVEGAALALEGVDDVHGGDGLSASVLGVGHGVTDDVLEEHLEYAAGLFVDEATDALDATTACETADSGLGDALDVVAQHLAVALGAALAESLASFTASRHVVSSVLLFEM